MKLPTSIRYGVLSLWDIVNNSATDLTTACTISERQGISAAYIEQIFHKLKKGGPLITRSGPSGGYCLAKNPDDVSLGDIIRALNGRDIELVPGSGGKKDPKKSFPRNEEFLMSDVWGQASKILTNYFDGITLGNLCAKANYPPPRHKRRGQFLRKATAGAYVRNNGWTPVLCHSAE